MLLSRTQLQMKKSRVCRLCFSALSAPCSPSRLQNVRSGQAQPIRAGRQLISNWGVLDIAFPFATKRLQSLTGLWQRSNGTWCGCLCGAWSAKIFAYASGIASTSRTKLPYGGSSMSKTESEKFRGCWMKPQPSPELAIESMVSRSEAEIGLIVRSDLKRLGIGEFLLREMLARSARQGLKTVSALVLWENSVMLRLATKIGCVRREATA